MNTLFPARLCSTKWFALPLLLLLLLHISCQQQPATEVAAADDTRYLELSIADIQQRYAEGTLTASELVQVYLNRIEEIDQNGPGLNSMLQLNPDALQIAQALDAERKAGNIRGPLHGIPVVLKDNIDTHDKMATTAGSRALANSRPLQDSHVARKLREAGAIILGKANLSEWANFRGELSTSGWSGLGGQTKNPYDTSRNPCGSSSGSGVAVSANLTVLAIGTETNGSIVCPAHANGIVGIKPTVGLVSRSGVIPISSTQDTPGPMARTVRDAAIGLGVLAGPDVADAQTAASQGNYHTDYTRFLKADGLRGKRIGFLKSSLGRNYKVDSLMQQAVAFMKGQGAEIVEIDRMPGGEVGGYSFEIMLYEYKEGLNKYFASLGPDAPIKSVEELIAFNKADSLELRYYGQQYLEMAQAKGDLSTKEYQEALAKMQKGSREEGIDKLMGEHSLDAIIAPTGSPAWKTDLINGDSFQLGSSSPAARAGYPNITVPMGFVEHLPVGISFFGRAWSEPLLLEIAYAYEQGTKHRKAPAFIRGN
ncbi:amidase [Cesiribacter andamanensis]|uniref:Glutamyl-tRNA(Gln) amidotransferase subunit A n=1 Tax=Cesiribacter andamanensis AMV16 TaxID=1279009 RepID=M7N2H4_9BACT|nr:amidase [Cesiribacter andamanensis]EMR01416.1 Glutamyl-tRNA(Gln) amidotransferase subunit A [Cesiribacter andamanensis AMV16]